MAAFLDGQIPFGRIADVIAGTLDAIAREPAVDLDAVRLADSRARQHAAALMRQP